MQSVLKTRSAVIGALSLFAAGAFSVSAPAPVSAAPRVTVAVTETIAGVNPYADSVTLMYSVWCQVYGCMVRYEPEKQSYTSDFFESWKVEDPNTWVFTLKPDLKRHNGEPVVLEDFVHSINRAKTDPQTRQAFRVQDITDVQIRDPRTLVLKTKNPAAPLLSSLFQVIVTSKAQWDKHGKDADRDHPYGIGPYKLKQLVVDNFVALEKFKGHPLVSEDNPDEIVFQIMKEPEQRVTALFNGEVQIAQFIPPHMVDRVKQNTSVRIEMSDSIEAMFLAMSPVKPFDNKLVRQAVGYAIDRDAIIRALLQGQAVKLDGPVGPGQIGYTPDQGPKYTFNPAKSRELLKQAGYPNGVAVELNATVGRYTVDKQICEAIASMLNRAGFKVTLKTPEWSTLWANVQRGGVPFYYMGRGSIVDPSEMMYQYFGTGGSPRIGYSNPQLDALLKKEQATFDHAERMKVIHQAISLINEEAPAFFLWRHQLAWGISRNVDFKPPATNDIFGWTIKVRSK